MVARVFTTAFEGVEARPVEVQCAVTPGMPSFQIVGLPDKSVSEARERVRATMSELNLALPSKKITVNLSPADLPKEGSHFDLPIALSVLAALDIVPLEEAGRYVALGELSLDGRLISVLGALPAAATAASLDLSLICPKDCGAEAAWVGTASVFAAETMLQAVKHLSGERPLSPAQPGKITTHHPGLDFQDVRGQERAKRALEIAAAGRHHTLFTGPPGCGKSMMAARMPSILPPLSPREALETSMIHSVSGLIDQGGISMTRPFREPHHTASMAAIVGGGRSAKPGEISLAHNGVLFLDELPEFAKPVLETLRQPIETGKVVVSRANAHVEYPCGFLLLAAANPCRCGHLADANQACNRAPLCSQDYLGKISGPLLDRFDIRLDLSPVTFEALSDLPKGEPSAKIAARVARARDVQLSRADDDDKDIRLNGDISGGHIQKVAAPSVQALEMLTQAAERFQLSARGYHRVLKVARTIADLDGAQLVDVPHLAEALVFRGLPVFLKSAA
ncbi:MAG: YifB family Mg chelatase-like AAA ATPase [Pseudomonadota bacterium]